MRGCGKYLFTRAGQPILAPESGGTITLIAGGVVVVLGVAKRELLFQNDRP